MKPIAVISSNLYGTVTWLGETKNIIRYIENRLTCIDNLGQEYQIIQRTDQARGMEFSDYLIAPDYREPESLINLVKSRIR